MKRFLFGLIAVVAFSVSGFANSNDNTENPENPETMEKAVITVESKDFKQSYSFNSLKEFTDFSEKIIESLGDLPPDDVCTVTIEMSVTVRVEATIAVVGGFVETTVKGSVTASCAGAVAAGKALKAQLLAMAS